MQTLITCPECHERFDADDSAADQVCPKCAHTFQPQAKAPYTESIQSKPAEVTGKIARERDKEDDRPIERPRSPRSPFPWTALLILLVGLLFFALVFSAGFNIWVIARPDDPFFRNNVALQQAVERQRLAEIQAEQARQAERAAEENARRLQRERDVLQAEREILQARIRELMKK